MAPHRLSRRDARRIALRAQLLDGSRPADLGQVLHRLTAIQHDQTATVARNADLVLWSRLGEAYRPEVLDAAITDRSVVELRGFLRPAADLVLYRDDMSRWPGDGELTGYAKRISTWVASNDACRRDLLRRLRESGPMTSRELPDSCRVAWASSGWNNDRNVVMMLGFMEERGEVAVVGREGRDKLWDVAERVHPADPPVPSAEAKRLRDERRLQALGIARARVTQVPIEPNDVGEAGEPAVIDGVAGEWRVDPEQLGRRFTGRTALLSPLDRLVYDRARLADVFEYDYALEMYKPAAKRRWGYFALPILHGDRLVGKLDARFEPKRRGLRVDALHEDVPFTHEIAADVDREIAALDAWLAAVR